MFRIDNPLVNEMSNEYRRENEYREWVGEDSIGVDALKCAIILA